jgi:hypothetical protein
MRVIFENCFVTALGDVDLFKAIVGRPSFDAHRVTPIV